MADLKERLKDVRMKDIHKFYEENASEIKDENRAFADYVRFVIKEKGKSQQDIFLKADIPERY